MPATTVFGYSPDHFGYDPNTGSFQLDPNYHYSTGRVRMEFTDDDEYLDGDRSNNEVGEDSNQTATITTPQGKPITDGQVYVEQYGILQHPDGSYVSIDRIEINGELVGYIPSEPLEPGVSYSYAGGSDIDDDIDGSDNRMTYSQYEKRSVPCFASGTLIRTCRGDMPVEWLRPGDLVETVDKGLQPILWVGRKSVPQSQDTNPEIDPIHIPAYAFGHGQPSRELILSPQHFVQISNPRSELLFGHRDVHIAARHLAGQMGVRQSRPGPRFCYYHLLFARHEVIWANDTPVESLFLGDQAATLLSGRDRREILTALPDQTGHMRTSRRRLRSWEAALLAAEMSGRIESLRAAA